MNLKIWMKIVTIFSLLLLFAVTPLLSACSSDTDDTADNTDNTGDETQTVEEADEFEVVRTAVAGYLADMSGNINASDLQMQIAEGDAPTIISIRSAADYAKGHIPGAINKTFGELLALPKDDSYIVYCYTGQSASFATATMGIMGYDIQNLKFGMSSWTVDPEVYVRHYDPATTPGNFATETTVNTAGPFAHPILNNTDSNDDADILAAAAATVSPQYISASDLNLKIAEKEDMNIVSVRKTDIYEVGHIPGAIHIGLTNLADNLDQIDPDLPVYVYCYTGHTAAQAAALLQMLGYDAYSVSYGMCGWTSDAAITGGACLDPATVVGYAVEK